MNAANDTAVKRFVCEFVAIFIPNGPNAAVNRFGFADVQFVAIQLLIVNVCGLVRRRHATVVHLMITGDDDVDVPIAIVSIIMIVIIFVNIIVNGGVISAVQMLIYVIQFTD